MTLTMPAARAAGMDRPTLRDRVIRFDAEGGMRRLIKALGLSWQKTRPRHPKADKGAQERFKKAPSPAR